MNICEKYERLNFKSFINDFNKNFEIQDLKKNNSEKSYGILTGYYEPAIKAYSYPKSGAYPIYKHPKTSMEKISSNIPRKKINEGYLKNKNLEIAWVENEIEAFFLHIQGSGRLILEDKSFLKVRFAGSNNMNYTSLGKILIEKGYLSKKNIDMYKIKSWLYKNKDLGSVKL